jgi:hypothetical protein
MRSWLRGYDEFPRIRVTDESDGVKIVIGREK